MVWVDTRTIVRAVAFTYEAHSSADRLSVVRSLTCRFMNKRGVHFMSLISARDKCRILKPRSVSNSLHSLKAN